MSPFFKLCFSRRSIKMTTFGKKKRDIALVLSKRKPSKQKQQQRREMEERFKRLKAEEGGIEINIIERRRCSSNVGPKKGRRSSLLEVRAKLERLEEKVAGKRAATRILKQQLIEGETKVEASLQKLSQQRMVNALLFVENLRDQGLVNHLTRRILG